MSNWEIEKPSTDAILAGLLDNPFVVLPPKQNKIGASTVEWWEAEPGVAVIMASGGSAADRTLAEQVTKLDLEASGYKRAQFTFDVSEELRKTAAWSDIMAKAKRLIQSNQVELLRNGYNNIIGHIIGDHGEYQAEIGRDDPNSRAITTWECECPWDQYAWMRTRKWKKYEGRPCAHVLAMYWKSLATPLDEDVDPSGGGGGAGGGGGRKDISDGSIPEGRSFSPDGEPIQGDQMPIPGTTPEPEAPEAAPPTRTPSPADVSPEPVPPMAPPGQAEILPPPPMEQQQPLPPPMPGMTPPGMEAPPNSVSVPGARPQTPFNPIQYPGGTYSANETDFVGGEIIRIKNPAFGIAEGKSEAHGAGQYHEVPAGSTGEVIGQDPTTGWVDVIFPLDESGPMEPFHVRCFLEQGEVTKTRIRQPGPFIQRRR